MKTEKERKGARMKQKKEDNMNSYELPKCKIWGEGTARPNNSTPKI